MREGSTLGRAFADAQRGDDLVEETLQHEVLGALFEETSAPVTYDRFVILERVGAGAMGTVFSAYDPKLDRRVALKVMSSPSSVARDVHLGEARALARLSHPNVVVVHDAGQCRDSVFVAMEFVEGATLQAHLEAHAPGPEQIVALFLEAARGLSAAHRAGVVHRDFKPANVLVGHDGRVRVADFGLARTVEVVTEDGSDPGGTPQVSAIAGTPFYMAPELRAHGVANAGTDQYAFCVALREALGGAAPAKLPLSRRRRQAIARGLRERPAERFASMDALISALEPGAPRRAWAVGAVAVAAAAAAWAASPKADPCDAAAAPAEALWTPSRATDLEAALSSAAQPYAQVSSARIIERLGGYAGHLERAHREVCEAGAREEFTDAQRVRARQCLSRTRARFETTLELLGDPGAVAAADPLVAALPDADKCADADAQRTSALPLDASLRAEILALEVRLGELEARRIVGESPGTDALESLRARVEAVDFGPLQAELDYTLGMLAGGTPDAEPALRRALWRAEELGETDIAARAAEALARGASAGRRVGDARTWIDLATALRRRGGDRTTVRLAELETAMALDEGNLEAAAEHLEVYARLAEVGTDRLGVLFLGSELALARGEPATALEDLDAAVSLALAQYGPGSDAEGSALIKRGTAHLRIDQPQAAVNDLQRAVAVIEQVSGPDDNRTLEARNRLATAQLELGQHEASVKTYTTLEATISGRFGSPHYATMGIRRNLARAQRMAGDAAVSLQTCRAARVAAPEELDAAGRLELDLCEARALLATGVPVEAAQLLETWVEDPDAPEPGALRFIYGQARYEAGQTDVGLDWIRRAVEPARTGLEPGQLSEPERWLQRQGQPATR